MSLFCLNLQLSLGQTSGQSWLPAQWSQIYELGRLGDVLASYISMSLGLYVLKIFVCFHLGLFQEWS